MENLLIAHPAQAFLGLLLIVSALGVIFFPKPVHASLSFLLTLFTLAAFYLELQAEFIAVMQILVYAGAILVIFMYVIVLFQDAHLKISAVKPQNGLWFLWLAAAIFWLTFSFLGKKFIHFSASKASLPNDFGSVESVGEALYRNFFFPFEAVIVLFLVAIIGSVYIARKGY